MKGIFRKRTIQSITIQAQLIFKMFRSIAPRIVSEKYNVLWEGYNDHLRQMLHSMMKFDEFTDGTLVSDDLQEIQAHRVVLSACSPVLKNMLQKRNGGVPVIYLKGIKFSEMEPILQFMYLGITTVEQSKISGFLEVAKNLEIKELSKDVKMSDSPQNKRSIPEPQYQNIQKNTVIEDPLSMVESPSLKEVKPNVGQIFYDKNGKEFVNVEQVLGTVKSEPNKKLFKCDQCEHVFVDEGRFLEHYKTAHGPEAEVATNNASPSMIRGSSSKQNQSGQVQLYESLLVYRCKDQACDFKTKDKAEFKQHVVENHAPEKEYNCRKCNFFSTNKEELISHKLSKHPKITKPSEAPISKPVPLKNYACFMCQFKSPDKTILTNHIAAEHSEDIGNLVNQ